MKATVDADACIGCGLCPDICPEVFKLNDENVAEVIADPVAPESAGAAQEACDSCPVNAITIEQ
jgi:ferredoxin